MQLRRIMLSEVCKLGDYLTFKFDKFPDKEYITYVYDFEIHEFIDVLQGYEHANVKLSDSFDVQDLLIALDKINPWNDCCLVFCPEARMWGFYYIKKIH